MDDYADRHQGCCQQADVDEVHGFMVAPGALQHTRSPTNSVASANQGVLPWFAVDTKKPGCNIRSLDLPQGV